MQHASLMVVSSEDPTTLGMGLAAMARQTPIYFDDLIGMPIVIGSAEITTILRDTETFSTRVYQAGVMRDALVAQTGEAHTHMRKLYNGLFAPQQIKSYEQNIVAPTVRAVIDGLASHDPLDLLDHLCVEVPQRVVSSLFGMSIERIHENDRRVRDIMGSIVRPFDPEAAAVGAAAYAAIADELHAIAARELAEPSSTMLGEIAKALLATGEASVEACERIVLTLILGSYETTIWGLAASLAALLRFPDVQQRLIGEPELIPAAIEESWRWCGIALGGVRLVERETKIGDELLAPGSVVQVGWSGMHFDTAVYDAPERFMIERKAKPMIFGGGPHFCVGAALARMETRVTLSQLLARYPGLRADPDRPAPIFQTGVRGSIMFGPDHLPARLA